MFSTALSPEYFLPTPDLRPITTSGYAVIDLQVRVLPKWYEELSLDWVTPPSWVNKEPRFNVYRSEIEDGAFQKLTQVPIATPFYKDISTTESSKASQDFYVVEALLNDDTVWRTPVAYAGDRLPRWHAIRLKEIQRREWILLRRYVGVYDSTVLRLIRYDGPCPECYDKTSRKLLKDYCVTCYGTGVKGGYYPGFKTKIQFDASTENTIYTYFGKFEPNQIGAWTISIPNLEALDVIIRHKDFKVFRVKALQNTEILNKGCRQIMQLDEQGKESVLYKLIEREGLLNG